VWFLGDSSCLDLCGLEATLVRLPTGVWPGKRVPLVPAAPLDWIGSCWEGADFLGALIATPPNELFCREESCIHRGTVTWDHRSFRHGTLRHAAGMGR